MDRGVVVGISDVINSVHLCVPACALESLNKKNVPSSRVQLVKENYRIAQRTFVHTYICMYVCTSLSECSVELLK